MLTKLITKLERKSGIRRPPARALPLEQWLTYVQRVAPTCSDDVTKIRHQFLA